MSSPAAGLLRARHEPAAAWEAAVGQVVATGDPRADSPTLAHALPSADVLFVDGERDDVLDRLRAARALDGVIQLIIVAAPPRDGALRRQLLFTPGLGEVWIVQPAEVDAALVQRAADVTRSRRRHRRTRARIESTLASVPPADRRRHSISDAYLASLLDASLDPILSIDDTGRILSWNPGATRALGFTRAQAIGRPLTELLRIPEALLPEDTDDTPRRIEVSFTRSNGESGVAQCVISPVRTADTVVYAVLLHDLTRERRTQQMLEAQTTQLEAQATELESQARALEEYTQQLEQTNRLLRLRSQELEHAASARSRFYAAMSHELRTPINAIIGYNALVLEGIYGDVPSAPRHALERLQRAARHLQELVNDVLDLAKIEAGRLDLEAERACVPAIIEDLLDTVDPLASEHGTEVRLTTGEPHCIRTDPRRVRQILLNLLSNAIKFGRGRPVLVRWTVHDDGGISIDVVDHGVGIAPENIHRIFDEFTQLTPGSETGTGLGLSISRALARLLGGSLTVDSAPDVGSTFTLRLPAELR